MPLANSLSTANAAWIGLTRSGGGGGAAAFRSISSTTYASRTNTIVTAPTGIQNGDILLLVLILGASTPPTPTLPSGFSVLSGGPTTITDSGFSVACRLAWKLASSESGNYTATHATASSQGMMLAISGASSATPVSSVNNGTATLGTYTGITTPSNSSLVAGIQVAWDSWTGADAGISGTTPTFTARLDDTNQIYVGTGVLATAGATGSPTQGNNNAGAHPWLTFLVAAGP